MATTRAAQPARTSAQESIDAFIQEGIRLPKGKGAPSRAFPSQPVWQGLRAAGTELWLDTGDLEGAAGLWCAEFSALTTNNTLLYAEVKKGIYDELIGRAAQALGKDFDPRAAVVEIAFILNARHGLRLVERFGAKVSVELHTDLAHDIDGTLSYARRIYQICPENFIVKIPFTPAGLLATRKLRSEGVPINMTLEFSARQNYLAARFSNPSHVNVFLGRLNAYFADNRLGSGNLAGEKATLASQAGVDQVNGELRSRPPVRQIAASLRSADQAPALAGVDVFTMPLKVAEGVLASPPPAGWRSRKGENYQPEIDVQGAAREARSQLLWEIDDSLKKLAKSLDEKPPKTPADLVQRTREAGIQNLFPEFSRADAAALAADGKIPKHAAWKERIARGELAIDTLLNAAGYHSFAKDQQALDDRIRGLLGK